MALRMNGARRVGCDVVDEHARSGHGQGAVVADVVGVIVGFNSAFDDIERVRGDLRDSAIRRRRSTCT